LGAHGDANTIADSPGSVWLCAGVLVIVQRANTEILDCKFAAQNDDVGDEPE
jgi:hypothetical protein